MVSYREKKSKVKEEERGYCLIFFWKKVKENSGQAISPHARITRIYTFYHSSLKNYSRVGEFRPRQRATNLLLLSFHLSLSPPSPSFFFVFFKKKMKNCSPARLRTVRGAAPSGLTEKCIKGAMYEKFTSFLPFFRLFNDIYFHSIF